ncbi:cryptochrome-1-like [Oculina patagonica]
MSNATIHRRSNPLVSTEKSREQTDKGKHAIHWVRKDLRLHDNPSLLEAVKGSDTFRVIYVLDTKVNGQTGIGINLWRFLLQSLEDVDDSLRKLNSRLFVVRGQPADVFPRLFREWKTSLLTFEEDSEPFGRERDAAIRLLAKESGVDVTVCRAHTLYDPQLIIKHNGGTPPLTYKKFLAIIRSLGPPEHPVPTLDVQLLAGCGTPVSEDHEEKYGVPSLEELGLDVRNIHGEVWHGGEKEALIRLDRHLERKAWIASFEKPKVTPNSLFPSPTGVSPYLRFGCLSPRLFYHRLTELYRKVKTNDPPISLYGQLLWREFFFTVAANNPHFDRMATNPMCLQIPWRKSPERLKKWEEGKTGYPWIDAIMVQLRQEGWIHHLARHAVGCFLTRGDLWISWEEGMRVFERWLLDAEWSLNAGNWMWLSYSAFFQQFFNCLCPVGFGRKLDPNGDYVRKYLPVLKGFPAKYIHAPWTAPESVQKAARCIIGQDYPSPMVEHNKVSRANLEKLRNIFKALLCYKDSFAISSEKQDNVPDRQEKLKQQMFLLEDKENE